MATSASQRRLSAEQVQVFVERHDEARGSHHHCTQTNGHAPLRILHLAPQRRLGLLKVDLGDEGLGHALDNGVDQDPKSVPVEAALRRVAAATP